MQNQSMNHYSDKSKLDLLQGKIKNKAIEFATSIGMNIIDKSVPDMRSLSHKIFHNDGKTTYVHKMDLEFICHEIAHFQVASVERRFMPDYGLYGFTPKELVAIIDDSNYKDLIIPECIEDGRASILGDLHKTEFDNLFPDDPFSFFGRHGATSRVSCWKHNDAEIWLNKHGFIVDGKPTNKLNNMTTFATFADYF